MTRLSLTIVTLAGTEYVLFEREGAWAFPSDAFREGESPGAAARRVVEEWTGTTSPKLELMDFVAANDELRFVFRAILTSDPKGAVKRFPRMGLPERVGHLASKDVEEMQKTGLSYKLTRG